MTGLLGSATVDPPSAPPFYQHSEDQAGFHYDGTTFTQFGPPLSGDPNTVHINLSAAAAVASAPNQVYAVQADRNILYISSDGGLTWIQRTMAQFPDGLTINAPSISSMWARAVGEVYLVEARGNGSFDGIWRTLDDGLSWMCIVPFTDGLQTFGTHMAVGIQKLFYGQRVSRGTGASPRSDIWHFNRCNLDGSDIETWATYTFTQGSAGPGAWGRLPFGILLRAISDDFVIVANFSWNEGIPPAGFVWQITASGITDIRPSGLGQPWDALPLTATNWLAVGEGADSSHNVLVYRTTNGGSTWALATTVPALQGFAQNGAPNSYFMVNAPQPSTPSKVVMLGHADYNVQQIFWFSIDAAVTWNQIINTADPLDSGGAWTVYGPGGLASVCPGVPQVAVPSRLATIVG